MNRYCQAVISSESKKDIDRISENLIKKKLIAGCLITKGPSKFWWKKKIVKMNYYNANCFSLTRNKAKIIREVEGASSEEVPIISFVEIDGNKKFLRWIENSLN